MTNPTKERFEAKILKTESCWLWQAAKTRQGYGQFGYQGQMRGAHRVSYMLYKGRIPRGLFVLHNCHNPSCVNPEHLRLGTNLENMQDRKAQGTTYAPKGEAHHGAKFTKEVADEIRQLYADTKLSHKKIAEKYSCAKSTITGILTNARYV